MLKVMLALAKASQTSAHLLVNYSERELASDSNRQRELAEVLNNVGMLAQDALDQLDVVRADVRAHQQGRKT